MPRIREWIRRLWGTFRRDSFDAQMEEELQTHLEMAEQDMRRHGVPAEVAARDAIVRAGAVAQAMDKVRDQRGLPWLADFAQDVRHGLRTLRHAPMFTSVALLTLALAIGANTAIFSLVDLLVLRALPVQDPASLVEFTYRYPGDPRMNVFNPQNYQAFRTQNTVVSDVIGSTSVRIEQTITGPSGESLTGEYVTGLYFPVLGVLPASGRLLGPQDDEPGAAPIAVVSWSYWKNRLNLNPNVVGMHITVADQPMTVVGVAAEQFSGLIVGYKPDVWMPAALYRGARPLRFMLLARLKPGVSIERAQAEMRVLDRPRIEELARRDPQWRTVTLDLKSARAGMATPLHEQFTKPLLVLLGVVGILLLLACANIGSLLLARAAARQREMAVRVSLGAGRCRIVRQVLTESLLLSIAGAGLGVVAAYFAADMLVRTIISGTRLIGVPPRLDVTIDGRVLLFTMAVTVLATLLFGLAPAWSAFASSPALALKESTGAGQAKSRLLFGNGLVTAQVALSVVLLTLSQLYVGHLVQLRNRSLGFDRNSVLLVGIDTSRTGLKREQIDPLYADALARLEAIPGVRSATVSGMTPISGAGASHFVTVEGFQEAPQARRRLSLNGVAPKYFATFDTPVIAGRDFEVADGRGPRVAIINQAMVRHYFAGADPIGKYIWFEGEAQPFQIIGVVGDAKYDDVRTPAPPIMYMYHSQLFRPPTEFSIRTSVPPQTVADEVLRVIPDVLRNVTVTKVRTLSDQVDASIVPERLIAALSGFFGTVGVVLAAIGLYGLLAYTVARRTNEIGVRMALGAGRGDVIRLVAKSALWLVCAGLVIGAPIAIWSKRIAASMVQNLPPGGWLPILVGGAVTIGVALLAAYLPARRATRVDPLIALRSE